MHSTHVWWAAAAGAHLGAPDSALGVHPGIGDGGDLDEEQGPQAAVGGRVWRQLQAALQADLPKVADLLLLVAQRTPAPQRQEII